MSSQKRVCSELRDSAARCDAGTKFADANADVPVNDFQQECCVPKTCSDISGSCGIGFTANPLTTEVGTSTEFTAVCCTPVPPTCGDTTPQIPGVEYDCSQVTLAGIWRFDETAKNKQNPTGDTCCKVGMMSCLQLLMCFSGGARFHMLQLLCCRAVG